MKLINIALKYCKKTVSILLILLILVVPMMNTSKSYAQENTSYKITENISNEKYQIDREMINELLKKSQVTDWENFQDIMRIGSRFIVVDYYTGYYWVAERWMGANHADIETIDKDATYSLKRVYKDRENWKKRPVLIVFEDGSVYCASSFVIFHAGLDSEEYLKIVNNRSCGYGRGENYDYVKRNGANGHNCIHVRKSTNHFDGKVNHEHQANIDFLEKEKSKLNN